MDFTKFQEFGQKQLRSLSSLIDDFPWHDREAYAAWLSQTYYFVSHSTRLLALAASRFSIAEDALHLRFLEHMREEKSHEKLALLDVKALSKGLSPEFPETMSFYQTQYYWIEHVNPKAFFGYILCLEGLAVMRGKKIYEKTAAAHGDKPSAFIRVHGEEDIDHVEKLYQQLKTLSGKELEMIQKNMEQSCFLYGSMLVSAAKLADRGRTSNAA